MATSKSFHRLVFYQVSLIIILTGCDVFQPVTQNTYTERFALPGTIEVADGLYMDYSEINNLDWKEYLYWLDRIHGKESTQYKSALPDTNVWLQQDDSCWSVFTKLFFWNPAFNYSPVVGISQQQAMAYAQWRSDRVFENLLYRLNHLNLKISQDSNNYFSIAKYYNGEIDYLTTEERLDFYPEYTLPSSEQFQMALRYSDSVKETYSENTRSCEIPGSRLAQLPSTIGCPADEPENIENYARAFTSIPECAEKMPKALFHLHDNVREWLLDENTAAGGDWTHSTTTSDSVIFQTEPNAATGFRNVCVWRSVSVAP